MKLSLKYLTTLSFGCALLLSMSPVFADTGDTTAASPDEGEMSQTQDFDTCRTNGANSQQTIVDARLDKHDLIVLSGNDNEWRYVPVRRFLSYMMFWG
jgi:hypothetical protein